MGTTLEYWTDTEVAKLLGVARGTLMKNRSIGKNHPPYRRVGNKALYDPAEVKAWIERRFSVRRELADTNAKPGKKEV